ncbi:MAG: sensor histidine kinase [Candidatus Heimdallarchaeota archaeon]|nr:sensor histidine kinase [Candidatus Heimdallarchaeota archaeon]
MEIAVQEIRVFCLCENKQAIQNFLKSALSKTDVIRFIIDFTYSGIKSTAIYSGFTLKSYQISRKLTKDWIPTTFLSGIRTLLEEFPLSGLRSSFYLNFSKVKIPIDLVECLENQLKDFVSEYETSASYYSIFLERGYERKILNQLSLRYPFICFENGHVLPNFFYNTEKLNKFPNKLKELYLPIELLLDELDRNKLERDQLKKELFLQSTQNNILEATLSTFLAMEKEQREKGIESTPADMISLLDYKELRKRFDEKSQILSSVTHDLKSPLSAIQGFAELMKEGMAGDISEDMKKHLEVIIRNAKRLSIMVDSILEFESYDRSEYVLSREVVNLVELLNDAKMSVLPRMLQKNQKVNIYTPDTLEIVANRELLLRVIQNLLDNGIKYSPRDTGLIEVFAEEKVKNKQPYVKITIKDNGFGFKPEEVKKAFIPFTRFEAGISSTGLGLSISKKIIEDLHYGTIEISSPGKQKGTTLVITLPKS